MWFVYILECKDGSLYTGVTNDVEKRFSAHKNGVGARYTRSHKPKKILYRQRFKTRSYALKEEARIKNLKRADKFWLINNA